MRLKIQCDRESWKFLDFWVKVNKALDPNFFLDSDTVAILFVFDKNYPIVE